MKKCKPIAGQMFNLTMSDDLLRLHVNLIYVDYISMEIKMRLYYL